MSQFVTHHAHGSHPDQRTTTHGHHGSSSSSVATTPQAQAAENELFNNNPMDPAAQGVLQNARTCATAPGMDLVGGNPAPIPPAALRTVPVVAPPSDDVKAAAASGSSLSVPSSLDGKPGLGTRTASQIRMQAAGRKISAARILSNVEDWPTVRPPGIDPKRVNLPDLKAQVVVQVVDCCRSAVDFTVLTNPDVSAFLEKPRPEWSKIRWIHVNGLSWDVISPIALKYDLHPLSIEDLLHASSTRSKADYFAKSLFLSVVVHKTLSSNLEEDDVYAATNGDAKGQAGTKAQHRDEQANCFGFHRTHRDEEEIVESRDGSTSSVDYGSRASTPAPPHSHQAYTKNLMRAFKKINFNKEKGAEKKRILSHNSSGMSGRLRSAKRKLGSGKQNKTLRHMDQERTAARWTVAELTKDVKVHIHVEQLSIFVLRDGTIISFSQDEGYHPEISSILDRIASPDDLIRESEDASMVLQALLDVVADEALEIVDDFREQLTALEARVLSRPDMDDVRHLHILSSQLLLLKSTITPFQLMINAIRLQDEAKATAAFKIESDGSTVVPKYKGFVSHQAKLYFSDVLDHVDSTLSSLDLFAELAENLIALTFNHLSYQSNSYMQALSVLSVIFLPLTFLSSYFGMNFAVFPHLLDGSVDYFWKIAIPTTVVTVLIFSWTYLAQMANSLRRTAVRIYHRNLLARMEKDEKLE